MNILNYSALDLGNALKKGLCSVLEVTDALHQRLEATSFLNTVITIDWDQVQKDAALLQEKIEKGMLSSPLAGVPVLIKDNICTRFIPATCASKALLNFIPPYDAYVIEKMKTAGMLILGKSNMDEFAMGSTGETSFFGPVKNPWNPLYVPGGSSSGSAAAVAARSVFCALGTDTGGSIRQPASHCGITGIKPSYGRVSRRGLIAYASSMDQIGTMARSALDCQAILSIICGQDKLDFTSRNGKSIFSKAKGVRDLVIGIPENLLQAAQPEIQQCILNSAQIFTSMGAVVKWTKLSYTREAVAAYYILACAEASSNLGRYDGWKYGERTPAVTLNKQLCRTRSEKLGAEVKQRILLGSFVLSSGHFDDYYRKAEKARNLIRKAFQEAFEDCNLILTPTAPTTAPKIGEMLQEPVKMYQSDLHTVGVNLAGLPAICFPGGLTHSYMPVGIQLIAPDMEEALLFQAVEAFQNVSDFHLQSPEVNQSCSYNVSSD
ncbi:Asp-tRNA(Asn)/Glu-tRNA(Gln) amidotransferase subunit GatA [Ructibacterium gallinarum]|uniref:Glutamyl-tRNA(Gln) amidotransferase subunit A n=1 Tax=Ructibacterium gallinarum TaxID=2779355 RepID=A0A9D5R862_9FIRM|nr:Asp-tRNA(Asn)/Glu-tRNA(Gln) amidotransferase subunit GatA [Ructibacterium gallinarum]MBE5039642.1 Asp-tRNA(Asn)/Glu-tRNA(Gln) amidotransferase subunit GatA [Ructibacterium gallinarum]